MQGHPVGQQSIGVGTTCAAGQHRTAHAIQRPISLGLCLTCDQLSPFNNHKSSDFVSNSDCAVCEAANADRVTVGLLVSSEVAFPNMCFVGPVND